ncbi:Crp/Fnr family transcriptional regulator [Actinosynnema pretiosum subsp. pretiosum]|uniref:Crp/Fnr family transcriptional regulator n=1 Tax=Actinosynnema pretiosum subsp. pretiosum TaxID=103721 RepID=A0AA45LA52_9PSEU|nr:Crp/Fnr family transcriptional regulator [Actinosynnema pretiosum subsp. pretiosum]
MGISAKPFWDRLTEQERAYLTGVATFRAFPARARLAREGQQDEWVVVLRSGQAEIVAGWGREQVALLEAGDVVGEQAALDGRPRGTSVVAVTPVRALTVEGERFHAAMVRHPRIARVLCAVLSERVRQATRARGSASERYDDALTRVARFLLQEAESSRPDGGVSTPVHIQSQEALGSRLGLSRGSVVRAMRRLRGSSAVRTSHGRVVVEDLGALRSLVGAQVRTPTGVPAPHLI